MFMIKKIDDVINNNCKLYIYVDDKNLSSRKIYTVYKLYDVINIKCMDKNYTIKNHDFYSLLSKFNITSIKQLDHGYYKIECQYYTPKAIVIQRVWRRFIKKKLWNKIGLKLLTIIAPHLGNPELSGVKRRLLLNLN